MQISVPVLFPAKIIQLPWERLTEALGYEVPEIFSKEDFEIEESAPRHVLADLIKIELRVPSRNAFEASLEEQGLMDPKTILEHVSRERGRRNGRIEELLNIGRQLRAMENTTIIAMGSLTQKDLVAPAIESSSGEWKLDHVLPYSEKFWNRRHGEYLFLMIKEADLGKS